MWTPTTRRRHSRTGLRYASDLTDAEWAPIEPLPPAACGRGRPRSWPLRGIVNAILYVLRGGIAWRLLPTDSPPWQTAHRRFAAWRDAGLFATIDHAPVMADRERAGRGASPTAAIIDGQSLRTTEGGGPRGYDVGKGVKGRRRHALVDTDGRALVLVPQRRPTSRIAMAPCPSSRPRVPCFPSSSASSPTAAMRARKGRHRHPHRRRDRQEAHPDQVGSVVHPRAGGWSSGSSPGSAATGG